MEKEFQHIIRVVNTDLEGKKPIRHALLKIKGIGPMFANMVCHLAKVEKTKTAGELTPKEVEQLEKVIKDPLNNNVPVWMLNRRKDCETGEDKHLLSGDVKFVQENDIKTMKKIKCYKGFRHAFGLPARGQRTKSNFRRNKGKGLGVKKRAGAKSGRT